MRRSPYPEDAPPVFVGHYFKPANSPLLPERNNLAVIDHSAAKDGLLVAHRWRGSAKFRPEGFVSHRQ